MANKRAEQIVNSIWKPWVINGHTQGIITIAQEPYYFGFGYSQELIQHLVQVHNATIKPKEEVLEKFPGLAKLFDGNNHTDYATAIVNPQEKE